MYLFCKIVPLLEHITNLCLLLFKTPLFNLRRLLLETTPTIQLDVTRYSQVPFGDSHRRSRMKIRVLFPYSRVLLKQIWFPTTTDVLAKVSHFVWECYVSSSQVICYSFFSEMCSTKILYAKGDLKDSFFEKKFL